MSGTPLAGCLEQRHYRLGPQQVVSIKPHNKLPNRAAERSVESVGLPGVGLGGDRQPWVFNTAEPLESRVGRAAILHHGLDGNPRLVQRAPNGVDDIGAAIETRDEDRDLDLGVVVLTSAHALLTRI